jgi:hypothetical protein
MPSKIGNIFLRHSGQNGSKTHIAEYPRNIWGFFLEDNGAME